MSILSENQINIDLLHKRGSPFNRKETPVINTVVSVEIWNVKP